MTIFDVLNEIEFDKKPWAELDDEFKKTYSQFMLNRLVSSKSQYLPIIAKLSTMGLTDEQHYMFLTSVVKRQKHYFNYKSYKVNKPVDDKTLFAIMQEFKRGRKEALMYLDLLSVEDVKQIVNKWMPYYETYK